MFAEDPLGSLEMFERDPDRTLAQSLATHRGDEPRIPLAVTHEAEQVAVEVRAHAGRGDVLPREHDTGRLARHRRAIRTEKHLPVFGKRGRDDGPVFRLTDLHAERQSDAERPPVVAHADRRFELVDETSDASSEGASIGCLNEQVDVAVTCGVTARSGTEYDDLVDEGELAGREFLDEVAHEVACVG